MTKLDLDADIDRLARRFAWNYARGASGTNVAMARGGIYGLVWSYMHHWLDDHGSLPSGEHIIPPRMYYSRNGRKTSTTMTSPLRVDFTKLQEDDDYPKTGRDDTGVAPGDWPPPYVWDPQKRV
jgi:hypothetical protein